MFRNFLNVMLGCFLSLRPLPCISPFALDSLIIDPFFACLCYALVCLGFFSLHVFLELILYLSVLLHIISLLFYNSNCSSTHFFSQYLFPSFVCQCFHLWLSTCVRLSSFANNPFSLSTVYLLLSIDQSKLK